MSSNNYAILIGASILASATVLSTVVTVTRQNIPQPPILPAATPAVSLEAAQPITSPALASPTTVSSPVSSASPIVSNTPATAPNSPASPIRVSQLPTVLPATRSVATSPRPRALPSASVNSLSAVAKSAVAKSSARPAADQFIRAYYAKLQGGQYAGAWQDLATAFQQNRSANPGGFDGEYTKWWRSFGHKLYLGKIETVSTQADRAIVRAHCRFQGQAYLAQYTLTYEESSRSWKIINIRKLT